MWLPLRLLTFVSTLAFLYLATVTTIAAQPSIEGEWEGEVVLPGQALEFAISLQSYEGWSGVYSIPAQKVNNFPLSDIVVELPNITFKLGGGIPGNPLFTLSLSTEGDEMVGKFTQYNQTFDAKFWRAGSEKVGGEDAGSKKSLEERVEEIRMGLEKSRKNFNIPGLAVAIVKGDTILMAEGFGERNIEKGLPATSSTLFAIGSTTKAFTSVIIGTLVDEGKLDWDGRVIDYLPDFRLYDEYATNHITLRDLLSHQSGLPRHDLMWYGSDFSREELFHRLRYLKPTAELREKWQYQNLMFMTAGLVAERVTGKSWEELVQERIFDPLSMRRANFSVDDMQKSADYAMPYAEVEGKSKVIDFKNINSIGPAGSINASVEEMAAWLQLNLSDGDYKGNRVISPTSLSMIHSPQAIIPGGGSVQGLRFNLYGMGWMMNVYRGHKLIHHGGGIDGFVSHVALLPDDDIGIVVLTNQPSGLPQLAIFDIADRLLDLKPFNHLATAAAQLKVISDNSSEDPQSEDVARVKGTSPSWALEEYAGEYEDSGYGIIRIGVEGKRLVATFHGESLPLSHYHYDVFRADPEGEERAIQLLLSFQPDVAGGVAALEVPLEPTLDPIKFLKLPSPQLRNPNYLKQFVGNYNLPTQKAVVTLRDSNLTVTLPGQPEYQLQPKREVVGKFTDFYLANMSGFSARFEVEGGKVKRLIFIQPNGTFVAERQK
ncbi:MAG: serine hydrolase [Ignavibacteriae bacterium]|nr:serine hydrolase [Ignavibacteriota bacterium]MCB9215949.1 serine hydrolase [Ignavibacteria bacterium]